MKFSFVFFCIFGVLHGIELEDLKVLKKEYIKASFEQRKKIVGFSKEIKSSGEFILDNGTLYWNITKPIVSESKINSEGIFLYEDGKWIKNSQDYDKGLFLDLIYLDIDSLKKSFDIVLDSRHNSWHIILTPKNIWIKKIFSHIEMQGKDNIEKIILYEKNGDITINDFVLIEQK